MVNGLHKNVTLNVASCLWSLTMIYNSLKNVTQCTGQCCNIYSWKLEVWGIKVRYICYQYVYVLNGNDVVL